MQLDIIYHANDVIYSLIVKFTEISGSYITCEPIDDDSISYSCICYMAIVQSLKFL